MQKKTDVKMKNILKKGIIRKKSSLYKVSLKQKRVIKTGL